MLMIDLTYIKNFFPKFIAENPAFEKQMLKEYLQLLILDFLSTSKYAKNLTFIGGTNLRLIKGIDRFSENLDFDCKDLTNDGFIEMTDNVVRYLQNNGLNAEVKSKESKKITAFRRSIYFPELLFELRLSGHREERLLVKIEAQDQGILYKPVTTKVNGCGFFFSIQVPPDSVLCAMKLSALLSRQKGRDFYDVIFLLAQTKPDFTFLKASNNIGNLKTLKTALLKMLKTVNLEVKKRDFEHLLFNANSSKKILGFKEYIDIVLR